MATHTTHNSWGRTRGPKNIAGPPGSEVVVLAHGATPVTTGIASGEGARDGTTGYPTENQRYLHVTVNNDGTDDPGRDIEIWVYLHATELWSRLALHADLGGGPTDRLTNVGAGLVIDCSAQTVDTTYVVEILGVDRVAFVRDVGAWADAPAGVFAACSTF